MSSFIEQADLLHDWATEPRVHGIGERASIALRGRAVDLSGSASGVASLRQPTTSARAMVVRSSMATTDVADRAGDDIGWGHPNPDGELCASLDTDARLAHFDGLGEQSDTGAGWPSLDQQSAGPRSRSRPAPRAMNPYTTAATGVAGPAFRAAPGAGGAGLGVRPHRGRLHLLVVRIANYGRPELCVLPGVDRDAAALVDVLDTCALRPLYYRNVLCDADATRANILAALEQIKATAGSDDQVVIALFGHVAKQDHPLPRGPRIAFLTFESDPHPTAESVVLDFKTIASYMASFRAREVVVLVDTCYSGALPRDVLHEIARRLPGNEPGYLNRQSIFVGASAGEHQKAFDADAGGLLVPALTAALRGQVGSVGAGQPITILEAFLHATRVAAGLCAQLRIEQRPTHVSVGEAIEITRKPATSSAQSPTQRPRRVARHRGAMREAPAASAPHSCGRLEGNAVSVSQGPLLTRWSINLQALVAAMPADYSGMDEVVAAATQFNLLLRAATSQAAGAATNRRVTRRKRSPEAVDAKTAHLTARFGVDLRALLGAMSRDFPRTNELLGAACHFNAQLESAARDLRL